MWNEGHFTISKTYFIHWIIEVKTLFPGCSSDQYEYDYDEYNEYNVNTSEEESVHDKENAVTSLPQFLSQSTNLAVDSGETLTLPCYVNKYTCYIQISSS